MGGLEKSRSNSRQLEVGPTLKAIDRTAQQARFASQDERLEEQNAENVEQRFTLAIALYQENPDLFGRVSGELIKKLHENYQDQDSFRHQLWKDSARKRKQLKYLFKKSGDDPKKFDQYLSQNTSRFVSLDREAQLGVVKQLKEGWGYDGSVERLRKIVVIHSKELGDIRQIQLFIEDTEAMKAYKRLAAKGAEPEEAFEKAMQEASPELQKQYKDYLKEWENPSISDIFPNNVNALEKPRADELAKSVEEYAQGNAIIEIAAGQNVGTIDLGDNVIRTVGIFLVNRQPRLFIFDRNADNGVHGPISPSESAGVFSKVKIDDYFSARFRYFSTFESEKDPTKVMDQKLFRMVRAFLPSQEFNAQMRQMLNNLAYLTVKPDETYISMQDKINFFDSIVHDQSRTTHVQQLLLEKDLTKDGHSLSWFEKQV